MENRGPKNPPYRGGADPPSKEELDVKKRESSNERRTAVDPDVICSTGHEESHVQEQLQEEDVTMKRVAIEPDAINSLVEKSPPVRDEDVTMNRIALEPEAGHTVSRLKLPPAKSISSQQLLSPAPTMHPLPPAKAPALPPTTSSSPTHLPMPPRLLLPSPESTSNMTSTQASRHDATREHAMALLKRADEVLAQKEKRAFTTPKPDVITSAAVDLAPQERGGAVTVADAAVEVAPASKLASSAVERAPTPAPVASAAPAATLALPVVGYKHAISDESQDGDVPCKRSRTKMLIDERCFFAPLSKEDEQHDQSYMHDKGSCNPNFDNNTGAFISRKKVDSSKSKQGKKAKPQKGIYKDPWYYKDAEMEDGSGENDEGDHPKDTGLMYIEEVD